MAPNFECYVSQDTIPIVSRIIELGEKYADLSCSHFNAIPIHDPICILCFFSTFLFDLLLAKAAWNATTTYYECTQSTAL